MTKRMTLTEKLAAAEELSAARLAECGRLSAVAQNHEQAALEANRRLHDDTLGGGALARLTALERATEGAVRITRGVPALEPPDSWIVVRQKSGVAILGEHGDGRWPLVTELVADEMVWCLHYLTPEQAQHNREIEESYDDD